MTLSSPHAAQALTVADAILYEGYLLYPYRQSSRKNQARFQFGVLMPPAYAVVDDCEPSAAQTECLAEARDDAYARLAGVKLPGSHHRDDIALLAAEGRTAAPA